MKTLLQSIHEAVKLTPNPKDRRKIANLLRGSTPSYDIMNDVPRDLGRYVGGARETGWEWVSMNEIMSSKYTDDELYDLYVKCRKSW